MKDAITTKRHQLKIRPEFYNDVESGIKTFEFRNADRGFCVGDILSLREFDKGEFTGRELDRIVSYILPVRQHWPDAANYAVLGLYDDSLKPSLFYRDIDGCYHAYEGINMVSKAIEKRIAECKIKKQ